MNDEHLECGRALWLREREKERERENEEPGSAIS